MASPLNPWDPETIAKSGARRHLPETSPPRHAADPYPWAMNTAPSDFGIIGLAVVVGLTALTLSRTQAFVDDR